MNLDHLRLFQRIVELGSLVAAARETGLSATTVSERLASLEDHLGVALLNRTTRSISLTEAGRTLWHGAEPLLEETASLESKIRHSAETLSGPIRISAPSDLGRNLVSIEIERFQIKNPGVQFELHLFDGYTDIVGDGVDIALRFGPIPDSSLRVRSLGERSRIVCASPDYITRNGRPGSPEDLLDHKCLLMRFGELLDNQWVFLKGSRKRKVIVRGYRMSNDGHVVRMWCLAGAGIALKSELDISDDLHAGRLVSLLEEFKAPPTPLQMLFPPNRRQPTRVRAFADHLAQSINSPSWRKAKFVAE